MAAYCERDARGLWRAEDPWRVSPSSGSWSLQPTLWGVGTTGPRPSGWGLSDGAPLRRPRPSAPQLPPRRHLDGPAPVPAALRCGYHCGALPLLGQKLRGYDDPGRRPDGGGEPFLLPSAHPTDGPASPLSGACTPAAREPAMPAGHPLRRRGWDALCRATLSIHSKGV